MYSIESTSATQLASIMSLDTPTVVQTRSPSVDWINTRTFDAVASRILDAGGAVALPKYALPGLAWQGYFLDTEGNTFGVHSPDPNAA